MRDFLKVVMYAGAAMSVASLVLPELAGIHLGKTENDVLVWGGLAMVVIGFVGRMVSRPES